MISSTYAVVLWLSVAIFALTTALYLRTGRASMFHPATIYLVIHGLTFVLRPLLAYYRDYGMIYESYQFQPSVSDKLIVIIGANLSLIVFVTASLFFGKTKIPFSIIAKRELASYRLPVWIAWAVLGIPAMYSLYVVLGATAGGGDALWALDAETGTTISTGTNGYVIGSQLMLATLVGMLAFVYRFRWWTLIPFIAFVILKSGTGGRGPFISCVFFVVLLFLYQERRRWLTASTLVMGALALLLFRVVGDYRDVGFQQILRGGEASAGARDMRFLESMDWGSMEFFEYLVYAVPQRTGTYDKFISYLQLFTEPVPRMLWTSKPIGAPIKMFNLFNYGYPIGMTYSIPGAGWFELGWVGIVIVALLFAWIYGRAYDRFARGRQTVFGIMLYCALMMTAIVAIRDGLLLTIARQSLFYLTPVLFVQLVSVGLSYGAAPIVGPKYEQESPRERRKARMSELGARLAGPTGPSEA